MIAENIGTGLTAYGLTFDLAGAAYVAAAFFSRPAEVAPRLIPGVGLDIEEPEDQQMEEPVRVPAA